MTSGIYKITNKQNGKVYVGSSKDMKAREYQHFYRLRKGNHYNVKLQRSFDKHGESEFIFEVLAEVEESNLFEVEQEFIDSYDAWKNGYNQSPTAITFGSCPTHGFAAKKGERRVSKKNVCVRPFEDQVSKLKAVPDLPERLRAFFDDLISGQSGSSD